MSRRLLVAVLIAIVVADLAQPATLPWRPKFYAALGGAAIYATCAWGIARHWRPALWVVIAMPVIPVTVLVLHVAGVAVPASPDAAMVAVLVLQLAAAGLAIGVSRGHRTDPLSPPPG